MGPAQSIKTSLRKSVSFSGRAIRSEFWWFAPFWLFAVVALHSAVIQTLNLKLFTKEQILGSMILLIILSLPALSVAARRATDAGFDISWVGYGFGAVVFGNGLMDIQASSANISNQTWFTPVGLSMEAIGIFVLIFILSRPSKSSINPNEVPQ